MSLNDQIQALVNRQGSAAENELLTLPVTLYVPLNTATAGSSKAYEAILDRRLEAIHKPIAGVNKTVAKMYGHHPKEPAIHDCAAWRLAHELGGVLEEIYAPTVMWADPNTNSWGSLSKRWAGAGGGLPLSQAIQARWDQAKAAAFFDSLIGQQDRNANNLKWDVASNHLGLFDHGFAFALPDGRHYFNASYFVQERWSRGEEDLEPWETQGLADLVASYDLLGMRAFLSKDRADRLGGRAQKMLAQGTILRLGDL